MCSLNSNTSITAVFSTNYSFYFITGALYWASTVRWPAWMLLQDLETSLLLPPMTLWSRSGDTNRALWLLKARPDLDQSQRPFLAPLDNMLWPSPNMAPFCCGITCLTLNKSCKKGSKKDKSADHYYLDIGQPLAKSCNLAWFCFCFYEVGGSCFIAKGKTWQKTMIPDTCLSYLAKKFVLTWIS